MNHLQNKHFTPFTTYQSDHQQKSFSGNALGMREMQAMLWQKRGEQYLLLKAPPASGKSRALMFVALDKLKNQGLKKCIIVVPERSIGASFGNEKLTKNGFWADWEVSEKHNLCFKSGSETSKSTMAALEEFLAEEIPEGEEFSSKGRVLICCHATFRRVFETLDPEIFDDCFIAVDEFHHVSHEGDNILGNNVRELLERGKAHLMAMTGSFFRGDGEAVLHPDDEAKFTQVSYSYYQQLQSYQYLKDLDLGYYFYPFGNWLESLPDVIDITQKTIIHIPNVNAAEAGFLTKDQQVDAIIEIFGEHVGVDPKTGFQLVKPKNPKLLPKNKILKIVDLVNDNLRTREQVMRAIRAEEIKTNPDYVDVIIALGMAKEGFDWIWANQAITIGYRSSLTEIVQIIGRVTRDAKGKSYARFVNMIAEPVVSQECATEMVNELLKAVSVSMLMEQALVPKLSFVPKNKESPKEGVEWAEDGSLIVHVKDIKMPQSAEGQRIIQEDLDLLDVSLMNDPKLALKALGLDIIPQEITVEAVGKIINTRYPELSDEDKEAVRQHWIAHLAAVTEAKRLAQEMQNRQGDLLGSEAGEVQGAAMAVEKSPQLSTRDILVEGIKKWQLSTGELNIDLIESVNPFRNAYNILSKTLNEETFKFIQDAVNQRKIHLSYEEAQQRAQAAVRFKQDKNRLPDLRSNDPWERHLAEGVAAYAAYRKKALQEKTTLSEGEV